MRGVNKVILVGTLGKDPELKTFSNGGSIANVSIATSEQWTDKQTGEKKEATEWHKVVFSGKLAEIAAQYLRKGSKVYIEGSIKTRKYQDNDGSDKYITEVKALSMQMLDSAGGQQASNQGGGNQYGQQAAQQPQQYAQNQPHQYGNQSNNNTNHGQF